MTKTLGTDVRRILEEAKALIAGKRLDEAMNVYRGAFDRFRAEGDHFAATNLAHMAGVAEPDATTKHEWNVRALEEADAEEDRESVKGFYSSLHHNLAYSHMLLGDRDAARRALEEAWRHVDALPPGPSAEQAKRVIQKKLEELEGRG